MAVPVDGVHHAPGSHHVTVETGDWPAGPYVCRLQVGSHVEVRTLSRVR